MKKLLSILLITVMCVSFAGCASTTTTVEESEESSLEFRLPEWVSWGMKEGEVRQHLKHYGSIYSRDDVVYAYEYLTDWGCDLEVRCGISNDNQLLAMQYRYTYEDAIMEEPQSYNIFLELKSMMLQEYGDPIMEDEKWINDKYKGDEYMMNKAADEGDYMAQIVWQFDGKYCVLTLKKDAVITYMPDSNELPNYTEK